MIQFLQQLSLEYSASLGRTFLRQKGAWCLPGVIVRSDLTFRQNIAETDLIRVALPLVIIEVFPACYGVFADTAGELGARLLNH